MLKATTTNRFEKDIKLAQKRGKNLDKIRKIMQDLLNEKKLLPKHCDHCLIGNYIGRRECHIEPNWLLIYKLLQDEIIFERTGSHSDLYK